MSLSSPPPSSSVGGPNTSSFAPAPAPAPAQCPALNRTILKTDAVVFWNTRPILNGHNLYRFGETNNITVLLVPAATPSVRRGYVVGLISVPLFMLAFFAAWLFLLAIFKAGGRRRFGFLSGKRIVLPSPPEAAVSAAAKDEDDIMGGTNDIDDDPDESPREIISRRNDEELARPFSLAEEEELKPPPSPLPHNALTSATNGCRTSSCASQPTRFEEGEGNDDEGPTKQSQQKLRDWRRLVRVRRVRLARIRIAVLFSGLMIVVMAILLLVYGVQNLSESVAASLSGIDAALALCDAALVLLGSYATFRNETVTVAEKAVVTTNATVCPQLQALLCGNAGSRCTDFLNQLVVALQENNVVLDSVLSVKADVTRIQGILAQARSTIVSFNWAFWIAAAAVTLLAVCTLILMSGVVAVWRKGSSSHFHDDHHHITSPSLEGREGKRWYLCTSRFRGWVVVPVFVFLLVVGWVFSMVFVVGSMASADFCYDSPDQNVLAILESMKDDFSSVLYPLLVYYVSGCPRIDIVEDKVLPLARATINYLTDADALLTNLTAASPEIAAVCGTDPSAVRVVLSELSSLLCLTAKTVLDTIDFFTCANWNGLYASVMYTSICYNGNTGFGWIAATQTVILLCSLVFLTLRVAFYELVDEAELKPPPDRFRGCRRWLANCCGSGASSSSRSPASPMFESVESVAKEEMGTAKANDAMDCQTLPLTTVSETPVVGEEDDVRIRSRSLLAGDLG